MDASYTPRYFFTQTLEAPQGMLPMRSMHPLHVYSSLMVTGCEFSLPDAPAPCQCDIGCQHEEGAFARLLR